MAPPDTPPTRAPRSPGELFKIFTRLSLQGFGGVLPIAQRELVDRERWLTQEQFVELLSICQVLPGPNVVNLSLVFGDRQFGWRGALAALGGMLLAPMAIVVLLAAAYAHWAAVPAVAGALRGMGAAAAGLIVGTGVKMFASMKRNPMGRAMCSAYTGVALVMLVWLRWPLAWIVLGLGLVSVGNAWWAIRRGSGR